MAMAAHALRGDRIVIINIKAKIKRDQEQAAIAARRSGWSVYRRAFRKALAQIEYAPGVHALAAIDAHVATLPPYDPLKETWETVTVFERSHADMELLRSGLGWTDAQMDQLFLMAITIETGMAPR